MANKKKTPTRLSRKELDPKFQYRGAVKYKIDIGTPFVDAILVPLRGGLIENVSYEDAADGILRIEFDSPRTNLRAILIYTEE